MKLTAFIMLVTCLQTSATGVAQQTITFSGKEVSLENVFAAIKKQTNYKFFFNIESIHHARAVTIEVKNASIEQVLNVALKDQPFTYTIKGRTVFIIQKKEEEKSSSFVSSAQGDPVTVTGRVVDDQGQPLVGANVKIKGTSIGVTTDKDGLFKLTNVEPDATLEISFVGHETQVIPVRGKSFFAVNLAQKLSLLDETQVIAYGTTTRRYATGNVSSVKASDIEKQPVNNPLLALEGRVPGLFITQSTGLPGSGVTVRVQGQNSIGYGNDPLYVIDGVPYTSQLLSTGMGSILGGSGGAVINGVGAGNGNPLSYINPSDIESIEILKDADATAIYGSRAANGAILITTKKGKNGQAKIGINLEQGWGQITRKLKLLNTQQYLQMRREAFHNDNVPLPSIITSPNNTDYDINGLWDTTRYTDWQKTFIGGTAKSTNLRGSVSGGTSSTQYLISGTYRRETTVFPGDFSDQKGSLHFSINSESANKRFGIQLSGNYLLDNDQLPNSDFTSTAVKLAPDAPLLYNQDGTINWAPTAYGASTFFNPMAKISVTYRNKTHNLLSGLKLNYEILRDLEIRCNLGFTNLITDEFNPFPLISSTPESRPNGTRGAFYANSVINSWIVEPQIAYKRNAKIGKFDILMGASIQQTNNKSQSWIGRGYNSDAVLEDINSASSITINSTINSMYKYNAIFGRINYNWRDKYILNLNAREDGSSRFGSKNQFHSFGSVGAAWIMSEERFFKSNFSILSYCKLRGSYGTTGNDQIGDYQFLNLYSPIGVSVPYQNTPAVSVNGLPNPYLQWEETKKLQFGVDFGLLEDRILINATYVRNKSSNQLLSYALPIITGFTGITENFPATVQNTAWELSLNTTNIKGKDLNWHSSFNLTIPHNKLVAFPDLANSTYASQLIIGQPITIIKVYHLLGVDPTTGKYSFADSHGNPTLSPNYSTDRTVLINSLPKFYGGFQNNFSYRGIQLQILFQFVKQVSNSYLFNNIPGRYLSGSNNQPVSVLNRWQKTGDISSIERFSQNSSLSSSRNSALNSDGVYSDGSYIRLKNLSLSWQLPEKWQKKAHLQNCQLYIQGQNLLTFTSYKGMDPENQSITLPPLRVLSIGLQLGL